MSQYCIRTSMYVDQHDDVQVRIFLKSARCYMLANPKHKVGSLSDPHVYVQLAGREMQLLQIQAEIRHERIKALRKRSGLPIS